MELEKKTTILFPPALHTRLTRLAKSRGVSLGNLVRSACETLYSDPPIESRKAAVERLAALSLPIADVATLKKQSVSRPKKLP